MHPRPAAPYIPSNPPRELKTKEVRTGLGAARNRAASAESARREKVQVVVFLMK